MCLILNSKFIQIGCKIFALEDEQIDKQKQITFRRILEAEMLHSQFSVFICF